MSGGDTKIDGVDFFETYNPAVSWITVRILLVLTLVLGLETHQVYYTHAIFQDPLEKLYLLSFQKGSKFLIKFYIFKSQSIDYIRVP